MYFHSPSQIRYLLNETNIISKVPELHGPKSDSTERTRLFEISSGKKLIGSDLNNMRPFVQHMAKVTQLHLPKTFASNLLPTVKLHSYLLKYLQECCQLPEKFTDVCMTGGIHYTPSHIIQTLVNFSIFNLHFLS